MDSLITYKYKDGLHPDIKYGEIEFDKGVYKNYVNSYDTDVQKDSPIESLSRRLWYCHLICTRDHQCREFLNDLKVFWTRPEGGFADQYEDEFKAVHEFLLKQAEIVEITFSLC